MHGSSIDDRDAGMSHLPGLEAELRKTVAGFLEHPAPLKTGDYVIRMGDPFRDLYLVRDGCFKAYADDVLGREHVYGFFFRGDVLGLDAISTGRYRANFTALQPSAVSLVPYSQLGALIERHPELLAEVLRLMSQNLGRSMWLTADHSASERLAGFLIMMEARYRALRGSNGTLDLFMSRRDIANYLRLSPESVSRLFTRFARDGLIRVEGHSVTILDPDGTRKLAAPLDGL